MFELKRTQARAAFKDMLGQANHFLITILIGLNGVREGTVSHDPDFHAAWHPKNVAASVDRSRMFALDLGLIRAVDALDAFMMLSRRLPSTLGNAEFEAEMDDAGQSVFNRFKIFLKHLQGVPEDHAAFMRLAIAWRNRKVHSLAEDELSGRDEEILLRSAGIAEDFRGLSVVELLRRFKASESPKFKDAASIIAVTHKVVEVFDARLLSALDIETYVKVSLRNMLGKSQTRSETLQREYAVRRIWADGVDRNKKVEHALRLVGVHRVEQVTTKEVPAMLVDR